MLKMELSSLIIMWSCMIIEIFIFTSGDGEMSAQDIVVVIVVALISVVGTMLATRRNQIVKNTEAIKKLGERLGLNEEKTLRIELSEQYYQIIAQMGAKLSDEPSLTKQHQLMREEMKNSYDEIKERYQKEDDAYRYFTANQKDLADTMTGFVRDYKTVVTKNAELRNENIKAQEQITELQSENKKLREKIRKIEERTPDGREGR